MENDDFKNIYISVNKDMASMFFYFLERGVKKEIQVGCDIKTMLSGQFNMSAEYIDNRIKTIFLDGRPVDDVNSTIVNDGSTLALSAAMPGLAGATFRRSENITPPESTIITKKEIKKQKHPKGIIIIKFFNLILRELGPAFLKSGILVSKDELLDFLFRQPKKFQKACKSVKIDGKIATIEALKQIDASDGSELLMLYVTSD